MQEYHTDNVGVYINDSVASLLVPSKATISGNTVRPQEGAFEDAEAAAVQNALEPRSPDPSAGFQPLPDFQVEKLVKLIVRKLHEICSQRHTAVDFKYWKKITRQILSTTSPSDALIIGARAGSGKSTWILAFLMALCSLYAANDPLAKSFGGVILVLQHVETLNEIAETLNRAVPCESPMMAALQGWTESAQRYRYCKNEDVSRHSECNPLRCPFANGCRILAFRRQAPSAFIVGMTQARFCTLRRNNELESYLWRLSPDSNSLVARRFLIFDEKFTFPQIDVLNQLTINQASSELEQLIRGREVPDSHIQGLQRSLSYNIERPFQTLRGNPGGIDFEMPDGLIAQQVGLCSLKGSDESQGLYYRHFRDSFAFKKRQRLLTNSLRECFAVMDQLYEGPPCLFSTAGGFRITAMTQPKINYPPCQTILFDATASVDGDYSRLPHVIHLSESEAKHMDKVVFHIYENPLCNATQSAMLKPWKLAAFTDLTADLVKAAKQPVFLCTYKKYAQALTDGLSAVLPAEAFQQIILLPNRKSPCIPYFGGTNGSNHFNHCTEVILIGYPRLDPQTYLQQAYAAWGPFDLPALGQMPSNRPPHISAVDDYQYHHLAARLEQEIYRCALRNAEEPLNINIRLFSPPLPLLDLLLSRFQGCAIKRYPTAPPCFAYRRDTSRLYEGERTCFSRLVDFFSTWDGAPIAVSTVRESLGISKSIWRDLMAEERTQKFMHSFNVYRQGRGRNCKFCQMNDYTPNSHVIPISKCS